MPSNILWIMTDQHRRDCVGSFARHEGLTDARRELTPSIDRLAENGVSFDRYYSTCPLCVPARGSLHTGRYPHSCGSTINGFGQQGDESSALLNEGEVTVDELLADAGYHMGHVGVNYVKCDPPLRKRVPFETFISNAEHRQHVEAKGLTLPDLSGHQHPCPTRFGDTIEDVRFSAPNPGTHPLAPDDYLDLYYGSQAARFIEQTPDDLPFALFSFLWLPHPPFVIPQKYLSMYSPGDVTPPPTLAGPQTGKPDMHLTHLPGQVGGNYTHDEWLETWAAYYGCVRLVDDAIGRILDALEASGKADDTLVIFHPDHGEMLGEHSYFQKMVCYEPSIRLPMIVRPPAGVAGSRRSQLCSHVDIAPTLLDYAGLDARDNIQGTSLRGYVENDAAGPDAVFSEYNGNVVPDVFQRAVVTDQHKYIWNMGGFEELYDLATDPLESENLAGSSECAETQADLRARLRAWMQQTGDTVTL